MRLTTPPIRGERAKSSRVTGKMAAPDARAL